MLCVSQGQSFDHRYEQCRYMNIRIVLILGWDIPVPTSELKSNKHLVRHDGEHGPNRRAKAIKSNASAANRTRGPSMATMDFTTKPLTLGDWASDIGLHQSGLASEIIQSLESTHTM